MKGQKERSFCDYRAIASGDLRDHMNKHYNLKPYICPVCGNSYGWQSGFKKHVQSHDKDKKPFKCTHCKLRFETQRERRRHELVHKNIAGPSQKKEGQSASNSSGGSHWTPTTPDPPSQNLPPNTSHSHVQPSYTMNQYNAHYTQDLTQNSGNSYLDYQHTSAYDFGNSSYPTPPPQYLSQQQMNYGQPQHQPAPPPSWALHNYETPGSFNHVPAPTPNNSSEAHLQWNDGSLSQGLSSSASTPSQGDPEPEEAGKIFQEPEDLR